MCIQQLPPGERLCYIQQQKTFNIDGSTPQLSLRNWICTPVCELQVATAHQRRANGRQRQKMK